MVLANRVYIIAIAVLAAIAGPSSPERRGLLPSRSSNSTEPGMKIDCIINNRVNDSYILKIFFNEVYRHIGKSFPTE